jgi:hypothetical protein
MGFGTERVDSVKMKEGQRVLARHPSKWAGGVMAALPRLQVESAGSIPVRSSQKQTNYKERISQ